MTFSTTFVTKMYGTARVDPAVLATSNGHTGMDAKSELGSTSHGSFSGAVGIRSRIGEGLGLVGSVVLGLVMSWMWMWIDW